MSLNPIFVDPTIDDVKGVRNFVTDKQHLR